MIHLPWPLRGPRFWLGAAVVSASLLSVAQASAQTYSEDVESTWYRPAGRRYESPQSWAFEVRIGTYRPRVDDEFSGAHPYKQVFGDSARVIVGAELDYQLFRIPYVGTIGPGAGWGYTKMSSMAKLSGTDIDSAEETSLWIMPMYAVGVLRLDGLARETGFPIVPYGKLGAGYALWKASNELGISRVNGVAGKGHSYGLYWAAGVALQLDFLDAHSVQQLDNSTGINHTYIFWEWVDSNLDGFGSGKQMRVGTSSWTMGLAFEI